MRRLAIVAAALALCAALSLVAGEDGPPISTTGHVLDGASQL